MSNQISVEEQVKIMEAQLGCFPNILEKLKYLNEFFKPDPMFTAEATQKVMHNISIALKNS